MRLFLLASFVLALVACGEVPETAADQSAQESAAASYKIAVVPKGTSHVFWKTVEAGAQKAGEDLGVEVTFKGPPGEQDRSRQIQLIQTLSQNHDAVAVAPLDSKALAKPVEQLVADGKPVLIFDSPLASDAGLSLVATDNKAGGRMAGEYLAKLINGKGKGVMLRFMAGSASTEAREAGFLEALKAFPEIEVISENQEGGGDRSSAQQKASTLLHRFGNEMTAVYTPNESTTGGMMLALREANKYEAGIVHVGFDSADDLIGSMKKR